MSANRKEDLKLQPDGSWLPIDVLEGLGDGIAVGGWLDSQGWREFLGLGDPDGPLSVRTWKRQPGVGPVEYLIEVSDGDLISPYLVVDNLADLMDMLGRWAPAVQATAILGTLSDLRNASTSTYGLVETVAARVVLGIEETVDQLRADKARRSTEAKRRREKREQ